MSITADDLGLLARDLIPVVAIVAMFTFLSIAAWADARKKEREAYYRSEVRKKLIEQWGGENTEQLMNLLRDDSKSTELRQLCDLASEDKPVDPRRRRERLFLAGLITAAVGAGLLIFLHSMHEVEAANIGVIPVIVGLALLIYSFFIGRM